MKFSITLFLVATLSVLSAQTDTLTYIFTDGNSVQSSAIGIINNKKSTLLMLGGNAYNIDDINYVTNAARTEKMILASTGSSSNIEIFRRTGEGKYADLYEQAIVDLVDYPYNYYPRDIKYYFEQDYALQPIKPKTIKSLLLNDPIGREYHKKIKSLRILETGISTYIISTFTYFFNANIKSKTLSNVVAISWPAGLIVAIAANRKKKRLAREAFRAVNGLN